MDDEARTQMEQRAEARGWVFAPTLWGLIEARAAVTPDAVLAHEDTGKELTFAGYRDACLRAAAGLYADHGVTAGTSVSWELPTWNESLVLVGALCRLGARQNPLIPIYRHREVGFITAQSEAALLVVPTVYRGFDFEAMAHEHRLRPTRAVGTGGRPGAARRRPVGAAAGRAHGLPAADAPVRWLFYTSGTTADPKGAHPHRPDGDGRRRWPWPSASTSGPTTSSALVFPFTHIGGIGWLIAVAADRLHPVDHRGLRPDRHTGVPGRQRRDPGRLGHPVPPGLPGRPAGRTATDPSSRTSAPTPGAGRRSRPSSTTT